jgi:hypothetical protein
MVKPTARSRPQGKQVRLSRTANAKLGHGDDAVFCIPASPANQRVADIQLDGPERRGSEASIVVRPPSQLRIDDLREIPDGCNGSTMQLPCSNLIADFPYRIGRDGWTETTKELPVPPVSWSRRNLSPRLLTNHGFDIVWIVFDTRSGGSLAFFFLGVT